MHVREAELGAKLHYAAGKLGGERSYVFLGDLAIAFLVDELGTGCLGLCTAETT